MTLPYDAHTNPPAETDGDVRILIVEDDDITRGLHEAVLSLRGYGTESAVDGLEALAMIDLGDYSLVLTDCAMPRLDGVGLVRALRRSGNRVPVMMVSGSVAAGGLPCDVRDEVIVALPKPASIHDLLKGVEVALGRGPARRPPERDAAAGELVPAIADALCPRKPTPLHR